MASNRHEAWTLRCLPTRQLKAVVYYEQLELRNLPANRLTDAVDPTLMKLIFH